jgi:hemin uptake protein HemP
MQVAFDPVRVPDASSSKEGQGPQAALPSRPQDISVESVELLRGSKMLGIRHNGSLYLLRTTKLGKLILTK